MRLALAASALSLIALGFGLPALAAQAGTATVSGPAAAPTAAAAIPAPAAADAAAKHVKRTACLKQAKTKKLIGAEKTAFLKNCIEAPQEAISASRQILPDRP